MKKIFAILLILLSFGKMSYAMESLGVKEDFKEPVTIKVYSSTGDEIFADPVAPSYGEIEHLGESKSFADLDGIIGKGLKGHFRYFDFITVGYQLTKGEVADLILQMKEGYIVSFPLSHYVVKDVKNIWVQQFPNRPNDFVYLFEMEYSISKEDIDKAYSYAEEKSEEMKLKEFNPGERIKRIHDFLALNFVADYSSTNSYPHELIRDGRGNSKAFAFLFQQFAEVLDLPAMPMKNKEGECWNYVNGSYLDAFSADMGSDTVNYEKYLLSYEDFGKTASALFVPGVTQDVERGIKTFKDYEKDMLMRGISEKIEGDKLSLYDIIRVQTKYLKKEATEIEKETKYTDDIKKEWTITFNKPVLYALPSQVFVTDDSGVIYAVFPQVSGDGNKIVMKNLTGFIRGKKYYLVIRDLISTDKSLMKDWIIMPFVVK